jgi:hypothetical protein
LYYASPINNGYRQNFSSMSSSLDSILAQAKETVARREGNTNQQHHDLLRQKDEELARLRSLLAERDRTSASSASAAAVAATGTPLVPASPPLLPCRAFEAQGLTRAVSISISIQEQGASTRSSCRRISKE